MRSNVNVPVGQGCRAMRFDDSLTVTLKNGCCAAHPDMFIKRCMGCGELFHTKAPQTKTCGNRCRKRLSRMRHEKMFQAVLGYAGVSML